VTRFGDFCDVVGGGGGFIFLPSGSTKRELYEIKDNIVFKLIYE